MAEAKKPEGCVASAAGPIVPEAGGGSAQATEQRQEAKMSATVGKAAPDFEATAFHAGGFENVRLSEFKGKWIFLCFYPGDFTFV
jgi:hypothetical protein